MGLFAGGDDLQTVADDIFGKSEVPDVGRVVARPTAIMDIWADVRQPRRAIPLSIRMHWNGNPADVPALLKQWHAVAEAAGADVDLEALLKGEGEGIDTDKLHSVAQEFIALARLAAHIHANGLINPITVIESDGRMLIESGERRWLAHHLLHMVLGGTWGKVLAAKGNANDSIWRQAGENTQRRQLNAIGMARQLALLIMAARGTTAPVGGYREYDEIVMSGTCDRRYYAQVADGNVHRIPRGMGERIQGAMGLGMEQLSQYRRLLKLTEDDLINDALWVRADVENWPERAIRDVSTLTMVKVRAVIEREGWTLDDLQALKDTAPIKTDMPHRAPVTTEWMHKRVMTKAGLVGTVISVIDDQITVRHDDPTKPRQNYYIDDLTVMAAQRGTPAISPHVAIGFDSGFVIGDTVRTRTGEIGEVVGISGRLLNVKTPNGTRTHEHSMLVKVPKPPPVVVRDMEEPETMVITIHVGDKVRTQYGRRGVVIALEGTAAMVRWNDTHEASSLHAAHLWADVDDIQINEDDIEDDVEDDGFEAAERFYSQPYSEGISIGGGRGIDTDKADSKAQTDAMLLINTSSKEWRLLHHLHNIAQVMADGVAVSTMDTLMEMTDAKARELAASGALKSVLDLSYDVTKAALDELLQGHFVGILQQIHDAGNQ